MILLDLLINFFYHFIYLLGIFILASFLVGLCEKYFYRLFGGKGRAVCIALGCVGTPLHESGHALMCLLFGHKIRKIVFFQPNSDDGCLGYVEHSYNNRNPYQVIGCFFIAIGPVLLGTAVLTGLLFLLCRSCFYDLTDIVGSLSHGSDLSFAYTWRYYWDILSGVFRAMYGEARIVAVSEDRAVLDDACLEDGALIAVNEPFASYEGSGFDIAVSVLAISGLDTRELTPYLFALHDALLDGGSLYLSFPSTDKISPYPKKLVDAWYAMDEKIYMKRYVPEDVLMALSMIGFSIRAIEKDESADLGDLTTIHAQKMAR